MTTDQPENSLSRPVRRFRWRIVLAGLNWGIGGIFVASVPLIVILRWKDLTLLPVSPGRPSIAFIAIALTSGLLMIIAGTKWVKGRWLQAILLDVVAYSLLGGADLLENSLRQQAIENAAKLRRDITY